MLQELWSLNQDLSRLRITYMASIPKGGSSHTVLVTEIPGIRTGTVLDTICRVRPHLVHVDLCAWVTSAAEN